VAMRTPDDILATAAALVLGLSAGALVTEGAVLVPFWRSLPPAEFLTWYAANAARLFNFFGPLEILAAAFAVGAAVSMHLRRRRRAPHMIVAAALSVVILALFPIYFRDVNTSFENATIRVENVPAELARWATWHWSRTAIGIASFAAALSALLYDRPKEARR